MTQLIILVALFLIFIGYKEYGLQKERKEEIKFLIRELSVSLKSEGAENYVHNLPDYGDEQNQKIEEDEELVPLDEVEPELLLRSISK